jgi:gliding motility-associated-like protein
VATGNIPSLIYTSPGNYILQLTAATANGCASFISNPVNIEAVPVADFMYSPACLNLPTQFTNTSGNGNIISYLWSFDNGITSITTHPVFTFVNERNYNVSLKAFTANGCESPAKTQVIVIAKTKPDAGKDMIVFKEAPFQLQAKGGISYIWTPAAFLNDNKIANPVGELIREQLFTVEVTDLRGCKATDEIKVSVFDHDDIYVPTSFTPNNDGRNDVFRPIAPPGVVYLFEVYNRWGQKIFSTPNQQNGWDGRMLGTLQPTGVYVWYLKAKTRTGIKVEKKGTVTLVW